jgi:folate-binding Fe-S cluster repair protein YgfZ
MNTGKDSAHTINVNKTCALQQTTGKQGTKHSLCEIDVNIINGVISFTHHEQYYINIHVQIYPFQYSWLTQYQCIL